MAIQVTIIILTYNSAPYLEETLNSVLKQKCDFNYEILVADDCSSDSTINIVKKYQELYPGKINLRINPKNGGIAYNLLTAIDLSKGKYCIGIAGDDFWIDDYMIQKQYDILEADKNLAAVYTNGYAFHHPDNTKRFKHLKAPSVSVFNIDYWIANGFFTINVQAFMFRKSLLPNPFEKWMYYAEQEDWMIIFFLLLKGQFYFLNDFASMYRMHPHNYTNSGNLIKKIKGGIELIKNLDEYSNYKYHEAIGNIAWRYERLAYAYWDLKQYKNFFGAVMEYLHRQKDISNIWRFAKTMLKVMFMGYKPKP